MAQEQLCFANLVGIVPAVIVMYFILRSYDMYLKDKYLAGMLAAGLVMGMLFFAFHLTIDQVALASLDGIIFVYILGFALFEDLAKLIILNYPTLHKEEGLSFYGVSLGLGMGVTSIMALAYLDVYLGGSNFGKDVLVFPTFIVLSFGFVSIQAATGALIGYGVKVEGLWRYLGLALLFHSFFNAALVGFWFTGFPDRFTMSIIVMTIGVGSLYLVYQRFITRSLPKKMMTDRRRKLRKGSKKRMARKRRERGIP